MAGAKRRRKKKYDFNYYLKSAKELRILKDSCTGEDNQQVLGVINDLLRAKHGDDAVLLSYCDRD